MICKPRHSVMQWMHKFGCSHSTIWCK